MFYIPFSTFLDDLFEKVFRPAKRLISCNLSRDIRYRNPKIRHFTKKSSMDISEEQWKVRLSPEQFKVLRLGGTEKPGTGN